MNTDISNKLLDNSNSPYYKLKSIGLDNVIWTNGFWKDRYEICKNNSLPELYRLMEDADSGHVFANFSIAAGMEHGEFKGVHWHDEWLYKWVEAASCVFAVTGDKIIDDRMDRIIDLIGRAQEKDGYIATQITARKWKRFEKIIHHELYVMGHLITAACIHYRSTGKTGFLDIAKRTGDFMYNAFIDRNPELQFFCFNPSYIMALVELYRTTHDKRYLDIAGTFLDMRGNHKSPANPTWDWQKEGTDLTQDRIPLRKESQLVGHSVLSTYLCCGAADIYMETGDQEILNALIRIWRDMTEKKMYVTSGIAALHRGFSIRKDEKGVHYPADDVHEAAGDDYEFPNATAYNETCAQVGNFMWNWRMLLITGEARYADLMEQSMYNGFLPGVGLDGSSWFYTNPLRWYGKEHPLHSSDAYQRFKPEIERYHVCCPTNVTRTISALGSYFYCVSEDGVWVNFYGGSIYEGRLLDGSELRLVQETRYPWEGNIRITVEKAPSHNFSVNLRIPSWARNFEVRINGAAAVLDVQPNTYAVLNRIWKTGDVLDIIMPLETRLMTGHPRIEHVRNQVAVMRGPVLYCLESYELPEEVGVLDVYLPRKYYLEPVFEADLLGGIVILKGMAKYCKDDNWENLLYKEIELWEIKDFELKLIPYFAWANRGISEMTVWIPLI